jgi:hypothetical protein
MRTIATLLILSIAALALAAPPPAWASVPMSADELSQAVGTNFWGGLVCGAAVAAAGVGTVALVTAVGAGSTVGLGVCFAYTVSVEVSALCALL